MPKTNPIKGTLSKIQEKLNISAYNKLYKEYEKANKKYNTLVTSKAPRKKGAKTLLFITTAQDREINTLVEKMKKYPEIHKTKEQDLKQDTKKREFNYLQRLYDDMTDTLEKDTRSLKTKTKLKESNVKELAKIEAKIEKVRKLVNATPLDKEALYEKEIKELKATFQEATSKLNADRSNEKAQTSYGDALLKFRTRMDQIETERRADTNMDDKNIDHLESLQNDREQIKLTLHDQEKDITSLNKLIASTTTRKSDIAKKLETLAQEQIEQEARIKESSKDPKLTALSTNKVSPIESKSKKVENTSKEKEQIAKPSKDPHTEVAQIKDAGETLKRYTPSKTERGTGPVIGTHRKNQQHINIPIR